MSNFEYLIIYDTSVKVDKDDIFSKALVKKYHYTEYESKFEEIVITSYSIHYTKLYEVRKLSLTGFPLMFMRAKYSLCWGAAAAARAPC